LEKEKPEEIMRGEMTDPVDVLALKKSSTLFRSGISRLRKSAYASCLVLFVV